MSVKCISLLSILIMLILLVACKEENSSKPNVILLVIDSLPTGHLKSYGYHRLTSPTINQLAKESIVFERMYTVGGYSCPSFISILTSLHPLEHGFTACRPGDNKKIPKSTLSLFDFFKSMDYRTGWFAPLNHFNINPDMGFKRSLDTISDDIMKPNSWNTFSSFLKNKSPFFVYAHTYFIHAPYLNSSNNDFFYAKNYSGKIPKNYDELIQSIATKRNLRLDEITENDKREVFWNLVEKKNPQDKKYLSDLLDDRIREFDKSISQMIKILKSEKKWNNTILLITSDHGEIFGKKGQFRHESLYEEVIHVPLIMRHPKKNPRRISTLVSTMDLFPTIVSFFKNETNSKLHGASIFNGINRKNIVSYHLDSISIIEWPWKLLKWENGQVELYNLEQDPSEKFDLSTTKNSIKQKLLFSLQLEKYKFFKNKRSH